MHPININDVLFPECIFEIFRCCDIKGLCASNVVCKKWHAQITIDVWQEVISKHIAFGSTQYEKFYSWKVVHTELPGEIYHEMMDLYQFAVRQRVSKTPLLVLIDPRLTLKKLGELIQPYLSTINSPVGYNSINDELISEKHAPAPNAISRDPYWVLMTDGIIGGEECAGRYDQLKALVETPKEKGLPKYQIPTAEEAVACIFAKMISSNCWEFGERAYTCTQNLMEEEFWVYVGEASSQGLTVQNENNLFAYSHEMGVAPLRILTRNP